MPQFVSSIPMDAGSGIHGSGNYIYITDRQDSLHVIDVSIPSSPQKVGYFATLGYKTTDVYAADTYIYLAQKHGLYILQNDILTGVKMTEPRPRQSSGSVKITPIHSIRQRPFHTSCKRQCMFSLPSVISAAAISERW